MAGAYAEHEWMSTADPARLTASLTLLVDGAFERGIIVSVGVCEVAIIWADLDHGAPLLEDKLETVLRRPIAVAFELDVDGVIAMPAPGDVQFASELNVAPDAFR